MNSVKRGVRTKLYGNFRKCGTRFYPVRSGAVRYKVLVMAKNSLEVRFPPCLQYRVEKKNVRNICSIWNENSDAKTQKFTKCDFPAYLQNKVEKKCEKCELIMLKQYFGQIYSITL